MHSFFVSLATGAPAMAVLAMIATAGQGKSDQRARVLTTVDHLVYAAPNLQTGIDRVEQLVGVRAVPGGQHPGRGTRNALVALGPTSYLEIIGPDPEQPAPAAGRPFGIDRLTAPAIVAWAAKGADLDAFAADARRRGVGLGEVSAGSRRRPDGVELRWRYTNPATVVEDGIVPFFIDWGTTPHPSGTAAKGATLVAFAAEHPEPDRVRAVLARLGLDLDVRRGPKPALVATISGPRGRVELR